MKMLFVAVVYLGLSLNVLAETGGSGMTQVDRDLIQASENADKTVRDIESQISILQTQVSTTDSELRTRANDMMRNGGLFGASPKDRERAAYLRERATDLQSQLDEANTNLQKAKARKEFADSQGAYAKNKSDALDKENVEYAKKKGKRKTSAQGAKGAKAQPASVGSGDGPSDGNTDSNSGSSEAAVSQERINSLNADIEALNVFRKIDHADLKLMTINQKLDLIEKEGDQGLIGIYLKSKMGQFVNSDLFCQAMKHCGPGGKRVSADKLNEVFPADTLYNDKNGSVNPKGGSKT